MAILFSTRFSACEDGKLVARRTSSYIQQSLRVRCFYRRMASALTDTNYVFDLFSPSEHLLAPQNLEILERIKYDEQEQEYVEYAIFNVPRNPNSRGV